MWKNYSRSYLKNNRASAVSVMAAAFIAALFLSLLSTVPYNFWAYEVEGIILEEGDWQGRIVGVIGEEDLAAVRNFAAVEKAVLNKDASPKDGAVMDIYFHNARTIYRDMSLIAAQFGPEKVTVQYHSLLLSRYLIHDPQDAEPPRLLTLYVVILLMVMASLVLIIRNSFELSMNARLHQFGIFSSIGATPRQIRLCLLQEALALSAGLAVVGGCLGAAISYGLIAAVNFYAAGAAGRHEGVYQYHPLLLAITALSTGLTVFFPAWIPARKLSRLTPLEAIRNAGGVELKKRKHSRLLSALFSIEGELAGNALKARKKTLRIATVSLLLSFLGFSLMLCFTTLSNISARYTYFERYQNAWDVMVTLKDTALSDFSLTKEIGAVPGARNVVLYQKAETAGVLPEDQQSDALQELGCFGSVTGETAQNGSFEVKVPIVVLDDDSFLEYCAQIGASPRLDRVVVLHQIWDSKNSNFRDRKYVPFVQETGRTTVLCGTGKDGDRNTGFILYPDCSGPAGGIRRLRSCAFYAVDTVGKPVRDHRRRRTGQLYPGLIRRNHRLDGAERFGTSGHAACGTGVQNRKREPYSGKDHQRPDNLRHGDDVLGFWRAAGGDRDREYLYLYSGIPAAAETGVCAIYVYRFDTGGDAEDVFR